MGASGGQPPGATRPPITEKTIRYGDRHRRRGIGFAGIALILPVLLLLGGGITGSLRRIDWERYRPFSWLLKDLDSTSAAEPATAWGELARRSSAGELSTANESALTDKLLTWAPSPSWAELAWVELQHRAAAGRLSPGQTRTWIGRLIRELDGTSPDPRRSWNALRQMRARGDFPGDQTAALTERALQEQAGPTTKPLHSDWMTFLGERVLDHALSPEQEKRFYAGATNLQFVVRPRIGAKDRVPYLIQTGASGPPDWREEIRFAGVWVDDKLQNGGGSMTGGIGMGSIGSSVEPQAPGRHRLRVKLNVSIALTDAAMEKKSTLYSASPEFTAEFESIAGASPIARISGPDAATMAKCISANSFHYDPTQYQPLSGQIEVKAIPVDVAFAVFARVNGKEYPMGSVIQSKGSTGSIGVGCTKELSPGPVPQIDIILRSSDDAARDSVSMFEIWAGEITLPGVKVQLPATRPGK